MRKYLGWRLVIPCGVTWKPPFTDESPTWCSFLEATAMAAGALGRIMWDYFGQLWKPSWRPCGPTKLVNGSPIGGSVFVFFVYIPTASVVKGRWLQLLSEENKPLDLVSGQLTWNENIWVARRLNTVHKLQLQGSFSASFCLPGELLSLLLFSFSCLRQAQISWW